MLTLIAGVERPDSVAYYDIVREEKKSSIKERKQEGSISYRIFPER